jgi:hypothetical protein
MLALGRFIGLEPNRLLTFFPITPISVHDLFS